MTSSDTVECVNCNNGGHRKKLPSDGVQTVEKLDGIGKKVQM